MSNVLVYTLAGTVHVLHPGDKAPPNLMTLLPLGATDAAIVDSSTLPPRDEFRSAWVISGGSVVHDMTKAKVINDANVARARREVAKGLVEREMLGENIAAERAALRATNHKPAADAAQSIADLKAAWPQGLKK